MKYPEAPAIMLTGKVQSLRNVMMRLNIHTKLRNYFRISLYFITFAFENH